MREWNQDDSKQEGNGLLLRWQGLWEVQVWRSQSRICFSFEMLVISMVYEVWLCLSQANGICLILFSHVDQGLQLKSLDHWGMVPVPGSQ